MTSNIYKFSNIFYISLSLLLSNVLHSNADDYSNQKELAEAIFSQMSVTYMCRNAIGGISHYQAARSIALNTFSLFVGRIEAARIVDQQDRKFRSDPRARNPNADPEKCLEIISDGYYRIDLLKAKIGK